MKFSIRCASQNSVPPFKQSPRRGRRRHCVQLSPIQATSKERFRCLTRHSYFNLDVFKQYREQLQNVFVSLQAIHGRITVQTSAISNDQKEPVQDIERDLIKNIEFLHIIFACAITAKGADRVNERLRALDFEPTNV